MSNKEMATEKRLKVRLYLSLLVYTVVGYGLTLYLGTTSFQNLTTVFLHGSIGGLVRCLFCIW